MEAKDILKTMIKRGVSDLHFKADSPPMVRIDGKLTSIGMKSTPADYIQDLAYSLMNEKQKKKFEKDDELDFSYTLEGVARFRINIYKQRATVALSMRVIPFDISSFESLNLPGEMLRKLCNEVRGLILIAGITGAGKTTTLNAMLEYINQNFEYHIVTIEDPIEFSHVDVKSSFSQREVGIDTQSFANALKFALRQDPDIVVIGELRTYEEVSTALTIAETGHLVLSTIHTIDAIRTVDRIINIFPQYQQEQVRLQLSNVLKAIIAQRLLPLKDGSGRIPVVEILINTSVIRKAILEKDYEKISKAMEKGEYYGMNTFDQALFKLFKDNKISTEIVIENAINPDDLKLQLTGIKKEQDIF